MTVLVVTKPTNLELHGDRVRENIQKGSMSPDNLLRLEDAHQQHYRSLEQVQAALSKHGFEFRVISRDEAWPSGVIYDFVLAVGGDGTLLSASHQIIQPTLLVGIRSSDASVGFTCTGGFQSIDKIVADMAQGKLKSITVSRIGVKLFSTTDNCIRATVPVLNDVLYANANPAATTRYRISFEGREDVQKSSGVWIATAIGSTAGIAAAGGKPLPFEDRRFQFRVRELYGAQDLSNPLTGEIFAPEDSKIIIENRSEAALMAMDGQHGIIHMDFGDRIEISRGPDLTLALPGGAS